MKTRLLILTLLALLASAAQALPPTARQGVEGWRQWGSGEMTWFGFSLYRATLWVAGTTPGVDPTALQLDYQRDIPRARLVQSSLDEMRRLGADETRLARWTVDLQRVFPDVKEGESIIGVHLPGQGARFYHRGVLSGEINDGEFARLFFAIWLDPATSRPDLRAALLKRPQG